MSPGVRQILRPSPLKWLGVLAICAALAWVGLAIRPTQALLGWSCAGFFGLGAVAAALNLLPGRSGLVLDEDGFEVVSLLRRWRVRWDEVARFGETRAGMQRLVGFDFVDGARPQVRLQRVNRGLSGYHGTLPDTYGLPVSDLVARLESWRRRRAG